MSLSESDLRYKYEVQLSDLIGSYVSINQISYPKRFKYRGLNLSYAIQRELYFRFISSDVVYHAFQSGHTDKPFQYCFVEDEIEFFFVSKFCPKLTVVIKKESLRQKARKRLRRIKNSICEVYNFYFNNSIKNSSNSFDGSIVFNILHEKFYRYLEPIFLKFTNQKIIVITTFDINKLINIPTNIELIDGRMLTRGFPVKLQASRYLRRYFSDILHSADKFLLCFQNSKPIKLAVVEGNAATDEIINQVAKFYGISSICFQQGWSPIIHSGFRNFCFDKMLMWGKGFSDILKPYNPKQEYVNVGTHTLHMRNPNEQAHYPKGIVFFFQSISKIITEPVWNDFIMLVGWASVQFPDFTIFVREHPSAPLSEEQKKKLKGTNIVFGNQSELSLNEIFNNCCISLSIFSTTILESIFAGVLPIILNPVVKRKFNPDVERWNAGIEVKTEQEARLVITGLLNSPVRLKNYKNGMERFAFDFFACEADAALKNILDELKY